MNATEIKDLVEKKTDEVEEKFHNTYRTRWSIKKMVGDALRDVAKEVSDSYKFE